MHAYNNFIDLDKKNIYNYDIDIIFDDSLEYINDLLNKIEILSLITKLFYKNIKYIPSSEDIINIINIFKIRDLKIYNNYIKDNENKYINTQYKLLDDNCLVSVCFDKLDEDWIVRNSKIFSKIYIISYKKYSINLDKVDIIYSENNPKDYLLDILFFSNDIKIYYNKIFYLSNCQNIGLLNGKTIDFNESIIREYIRNIHIKYNYKYNKTFFSFGNKFYDINTENYFFCRNRYFNFINSNIINVNRSKFIISPLILVNNSFTNKIYADECSKILSLYYPDNIFEIKNPFLIEKYVAEYNNNNLLIQKTTKNIIDFLEENYSISEFIIDNKKKMITRNDNLFSPYDYQFYDNSIIVELKNKSNINTDILLLCYIYQICHNYKKKLYIKWNHDTKYSEIFDDYFYFISDCNDNLKKYNPRLYNDSNDTLLISSNDTVSVISCNKLIVDNSFYNDINNMLNRIHWSNTILEFFNYLINTIKIDITKCICINIDDEDVNLLNKVVKYNYFNTIILNKVKTNHKYTQIPLNNTNIIHKILKLILLSRSKAYIDTEIIINNNYNIIKYNKYFNLNNLLESGKLFTINDTTNDIFIKESDNIINQVYQKKNIQNGTILILTSDELHNKILEKIGDIKYIDEVYIITSRTKNLYYNYKFKYFSSKYNNSITINNILRKCKYDKILISNFIVNHKFFIYNELDGSNYFINKSMNLCYFDLKQFLQLHGFNENSNEFLYDFSKRLTQIKYNKIYIKKKFDFSKKEYLNLYKNLKSWGKESTQIHAKIKKKGVATYILI